MFKQKILIIGSNSPDTDKKTSFLALKSRTINHGLIVDPDTTPTHSGYYHTSISDLFSGGIIKIAAKFEKIIMLDQPAEMWPHWKPLLSTFKVMLELEKLGHAVEFRDNSCVKNLLFFDNLLKENKSFCIYPWIQLLEEYGETFTCTKSTIPIKKLQEIENWQVDKDYLKIRDNILAGKQVENCQVCYSEEAGGHVSTRIHETMDWVAKLNFSSINDLKNITIPYYYEVRPANTCNLQCRMCKPYDSHLIEKEYKEIGIDMPVRNMVWGNYNHIDIDNLPAGARIHHTGGEPTMLPQFYEFLEKCIAKNRTDIEMTLNSNLQKVSNKLINIVKEFKNFNFNISMDGFQKVNDYIRWGSDWDTIIKNIHRIKETGANISFESVPSIWNLTNIYKLYEFLDQEFPETTIFIQQTYWHNDTISVYNHPAKDLVIESLSRCQQTKIYHSDARGNKSIIDSIKKYYIEEFILDKETLKKFFEFNDKLDQSRKIKLADYVPELENCRKFCD